MSKLQKQLLLNVEYLVHLLMLPREVSLKEKTFRAFSNSEREEIADSISVMGRSSPMTKLLVEALRRKGHVVAVTRDGINDALALPEVCALNYCHSQRIMHRDEKSHNI